MSDIEITQTKPEHTAGLSYLDEISFPTLAEDEWFSEAMYDAQLRAFPEGQFTALDGSLVVGGTMTFRTNVTFEDDTPDYYFDFIGQGYFTNHEPDGEWLYGVGMVVHPDYRRRGIGSRLYAARRDLARRLNLCGEVVAGLLPGYDDHRPHFSVNQYVEKVVAGELTDPTLTMQLRNGFRVKKLLPGFIHDSRSDDVCTLLVRENPDYIRGG